MFRYKFFPLSADIFLLSLQSKYFILYNKKDTQIAKVLRKNKARVSRSDFNVRPETIKLLEGSLGSKLLDISLSIYFLDIIFSGKGNKSKNK